MPDRQMCDGKVCYSERDAHIVLSDARRHDHHMRSSKIPKRVYRCKKCGCFHTTHLAAWVKVSDFQE